MQRSYISVLISSAGRRNELIGCFRQDAKRLGLDLRVLATDLRPALSPAAQIADKVYQVPECRDPRFADVLLELCLAEGVKLVVPTIDPELLPLSEHRRRFEGCGISVAISDPTTVQIARDKLATARMLSAAGIPTPASVSLSEYLEKPGVLTWPVIAKPRTGSSSVGIVRPRGIHDLFSMAAEDYVIQELRSGREYTVNMFCDKHGRLGCAIPHWRIEARGGEVSKGRTEDVQSLREAARKLAASLPGPRGALCFQAIVGEHGEFAIFELNARFGGGYPLAHRAGARFSQWMLEEIAGIPSTANDNWRAGVVMLRYDSAVYIDG